jgi:hypothetical protein
VVKEASACQFNQIAFILTDFSPSKDKVINKIEAINPKINVTLSHFHIEACQKLEELS